MTIKLMILKSGEELISDINEMVVGEDEEQKVIGYFLRRPCLVKMKPNFCDKNFGPVLENHSQPIGSCITPM